MMRKSIINILMICLLIVGCTKGTVTEDVFISPYDTTKIYSYSFDKEGAITQPFDGDADFSPYSLFVEDDTLYIGNRAENAVYRYNMTTKMYDKKFKYLNRTDPLSMLTNGDYLFVACGNSREVQIFNKFTGDYVSRLGTGVWSGNVSFATSIAQCENFIYVRDSKSGIRVFEKAKINYSVANNNSYFLNLNIDNLITSNVTPYPRDMRVYNDTLFVFDVPSASAYIYSASKINSRDVNYLRKIDFNTTYDNIRYVISMDVTNDRDVILKLNYNNQICYAYYDSDEFMKLNWDKPNKLIKSQGKNNFAQAGGFKHYKGVNLYSLNKEIEIVMVKMDSTIILSPIK